MAPATLTQCRHKCLGGEAGVIGDEKAHDVVVHVMASHFDRAFQHVDQPAPDGGELAPGFRSVGILERLGKRASVMR